MSSNKTISELYQILNVRSIEVVYPFCEYCFKKVTYLIDEKKFICQPCNERFYNVKYRYKLSLEVSNFSKFRVVSAFGKSLETLFGIDCNKFLSYKDLISKSENWNECLSMAFNCCLLNRWMLFEYYEKDTKKSANGDLVVKNISIPEVEKTNFLTIYDYLRSRKTLFREFSVFEFSDHEEESDQEHSVINETISLTQTDELEKGLELLSLNN